MRKFIRKVAKKAGRAVKRRYFKGKGFSKPNVGRMVKDVAFLKSIVNAEKKRLQVASTTRQVVAQVAGASSSGQYMLDITPTPTQGVSYNQRTGNSIKWHSSFINFQFTHQAATSAPVTLLIQIVKVVGEPYATLNPNALEDYLMPNPFCPSSTVYDLYAPRNPNSFKTFRVLRSKKVHVKCDQISGQPMLASVNCGLKLRNHHVKWQNDNTTLASGQVFIIIRANTGNSDNTTTWTGGEGVYITTPTTGIQFNYQYQHYYYDN